MAPCDEMNSCVSNPTSPAKMVKCDEGVVSEVASEKLQKGQNPGVKIEGLELSKPSIIRQKSSQGPDNGDVASKSDKGRIVSVNPEKVSQTSSTGVLALVPTQEARTPPMMPKKASQTPDSSVHTPQSGHEAGCMLSVVRALDDGYNWRKYGQKNVKGNEYIRSYYKCTYANCLVKKQIERALDGQITDTVYFGEHEHPKPQANLPLAVGFVVSIVEDRSAEPSATSANDKLCNVDVKNLKKMDYPAVATSDDVKSTLLQSNRRRDEVDNNDVPDSKRQKKDNHGALSMDKSTADQRVVVKTVSEVDIVNDGYRWRKYGQKLVKGNPNPRSYYRCSSPGCPVKKHVERASHDPKMVIATYEGQHDHDMPPGRVVTHNTVGQNNQTGALDGETGTKSGKNDAVCLDMVVYTSPDPHGTPPGKTVARDTVGENNQTAAQAGESGTKAKESSGPASKSDEQRNGESGSKSEVCDAAVSPNMAVKSSSGTGTQPSKVKNTKSGVKPEENDKVGLDAKDTQGKSTGKLNGQSKIKSEDGNKVCTDTTANATPGPANGEAEAVQG